MSVKLSINDIEKKIHKIHGNRVLLKPHQTYINGNQILSFVNIDKGDFESRLDCVLSGHEYVKNTGSKVPDFIKMIDKMIKAIK